jgi:pimeloyl-ACP methyl ester carboxylesterase
MSQRQINRRRPFARVGARLPRDVVPRPIGPIGSARKLIRPIGRAAVVQAYEMRLMASVAATAPLHLAGGVHQSFGAPTRVQASTAPTTRPVLLVHGFGGDTSRWSFVTRMLSARGLAVDAMTDTPFGTSVEQLAERLRNLHSVGRRSPIRRSSPLKPVWHSESTGVRR